MNRISDGDFLVLGYLKELSSEPCSFFWLSTKDRYLLEKRKFKSIPGEICSCRAFVLEQFRNKGLSGNYRRFVESFALEKGYETITSFVRKNNLPQIKALKNSGVCASGYLFRRKIFGKETITVKLHQ